MLLGQLLGEDEALCVHIIVLGVLEKVGCVDPKPLHELLAVEGNRRVLKRADRLVDDSQAGQAEFGEELAQKRELRLLIIGS